MSSQATLDQTLRFSRMLRQGASPESIQTGIANEARETINQVVTQLYQRQQSAEGQIRHLYARARELDPHSDIQTGAAALEETLSKLKESEELLETELKEKEKTLEQQQIVKASAKKTLETSKEILASIPPESRHETTLYKIGKNACRQIG